MRLLHHRQTATTAASGWTATASPPTRPEACTSSAATERWTPTQEARDYGDSFLKLSTSGTVQDYFSPSVQTSLDSGNLDLGAGGVLLLPDQSGAHPHEMVSAGKNGTIYLVDRDNMGHYQRRERPDRPEPRNIFPNNLGDRERATSARPSTGTARRTSPRSQARYRPSGSRTACSRRARRRKTCTDVRTSEAARWRSPQTAAATASSGRCRHGEHRAGHAARLRRDRPDERALQQRPGRRHATALTRGSSSPSRSSRTARSS